MAKILIHAAYPLWRKCSLVGFARAKELQDAGNDVTLTYCAAKSGTCVSNQTGNSIVCAICRNTTRRTAKRLNLKSLPLVPEEALHSDQAQVTVSEKKELVEGVLSGIISVFRILPDDIKRTGALSTIKKKTFATSLGLLAQLKRLMRHDAFDRFEVFNGRHACSKAGLLAAKSCSVPYNTLEVTASHQPIIHVGYTVHDRFGVQQRILRQPADMKLAEDFYLNRRRPRFNKFAKRHSSTFEPPPRCSFRRLVSVFLSSQDEFASLGKSWKSNFASDAEVVDRMCREFPDTLFCIRFHPNQMGIKSDVISAFRKTAELKNVVVYYPSSHVNTYQLVDASDIVVVFNSTVAAEACWMGKPVIMIGPSFYDQLDIGYTPATEQELWRLLGTEIAAKDRRNAARLAHYFVKDGDEMKYVRIEGGKMRAEGPQRSLPWLSVMARQYNALASKLIKRAI